jgi:hypothetical protein
MQKEINAADIKRYIDLILEDVKGSKLPYARGAKDIAREIRRMIVQMQKNDATP